MKATKYLLFLALSLPMILSCRGQLSKKPPIHLNPNMDQQMRFEPQESTIFFPDGRVNQRPVEGTIARGHLRQNTEYYQGITEDSTFVTEIPVDVTKSFIYRGKDRYAVFCTPCHGLAGDGEGIIMEGGYGFVPAPSFHQERLREVSDGYIFSVITNGIRNMPSYAHQIPVEDRWAIVAYVRALQYSQHVPENEIKEYNVDLTTLRSNFKEQQAARQALEEAAAAGGGGEISAERGRQIAEQNACFSCHSTDGSVIIGPSWKNLFGHEVELESGETVIADSAYIHESIVDPQAKIVAGFPPTMVPYDFLSESEIGSLIAYIKSLSEAENGQ
ncbi:MAG TPA: c-type cytochrome [Balneolaceae bacterium]